MDSKRKNLLLITLILAAFIAPFMGSCLNLAIPSIGEQYESSATMLGWIPTGYLLTTSAFSLPFGKLGDKIGKPLIFTMGIIFFVFIGILSIFAWSITSIIALRILHGIGSAAVFSTNMAILSDSVPAERRGRSLGYATASTYIGLSMGPVVGGFLNHNFGWRSIFAVTAIIGLFLMAGALYTFGIKGDKIQSIIPSAINGQTDDSNTLYFDWGGSALYAVSISGFLYGLSNFLNSFPALITLISSILLFIALIIRSNKRDDPLIPTGLFRHNTLFVFSNTAALINYCATFATSYMLSLYLQIILKMDSQLAGILLISQPLIMALLSPRAGRMSDRIEPRILSSIGMFLISIGLFIFAFLSFSFPLWLMVLVLVVIGIGFALFSSPNTNAVMSSVEKKDSGLASSMLSTVRTVGQAISMTLITLIISLHVGNTPLANAPPHSLLLCIRTGFLTFSLICALGIFFSFNRGRIRSKTI
ncbi:MAG: MFS transporter [Anaerovoracaceae bacterium]